LNFGGVIVRDAEAQHRHTSQCSAYDKPPTKHVARHRRGAMQRLRTGQAT
jgi:hypothetical protein